MGNWKHLSLQRSAIRGKAVALSMVVLSFSKFGKIISNQVHYNVVYQSEGGK